MIQQHSATMRGAFALLAGLFALACGDATEGMDADADATGVGAPGVSEQGGIIPPPKCTAPAKLVCPSPTPSGASPCYCALPPPPPVQNFQVIPDFYITQVVYAPPGRSSNIQYSSSNSMGTTTTASDGIRDDVKVSVEGSGSFFGSASVKVSGEVDTSTTRTDDLQVSTKFSNGYKKSGQVDSVDHNYDEIWFMMRPKLDVTFQPAGQAATQTASLKWKFAPQDGFTNGVNYMVYAGWLNSAMQMPADVKSTLDFFGITPAKYATLLQADPLFTGIMPNQTMDPSRYEYIGEFPYVPPFAQGDQASSQSYTVEQRTAMTSGTTFDTKYSVGLSVSAGFDVGLFKSKLDVANTWTWTNSLSVKNSSEVGMTDAFTVGQPAFGYNGPNLLHVYQDKIYRTYAFTLDRPQGVHNLAVRQPSYQSSDLPGYGAVASRANDGNTDGNFWNGSVTHTDAGQGQWWYVDLGGEKTVEEVRIFNRTDCCTERLSHYNLYAWDYYIGWKLISNHEADSTAGVSFLRWPANLVKTQYVMLQKTDDNYLNLAEVQVMGF